MIFSRKSFLICLISERTNTVKKKLLFLSILSLLLTSCKDKYEHTVEPTAGAIILYIFTLCIILPLLGMGISFLIRGIRRLKKNPPIANGKKLTITGGILSGIGLTILVIYTISYFPSPLSIPEANKYNNLEKVMKAATDESKCEFSVAQDYYPRYYKDQQLLLRDAIKGIKDYTSVPNFRKSNQDCDSFNYYIVLNNKNDYSVLPFIQVTIFENGNFFIDYVKRENNGSVSYYYKMKQTDAENVVAYAYQVRAKYKEDNYNSANSANSYIAQMKEEGKIENFFKEAKTIDGIKYSVSEDKDFDNNKRIIYASGFKKEKFEIIADFAYTPIDNLSLDEEKEGRSKELFTYNIGSSNSDVSIPWTLHLFYTEMNNYYVILVYRYVSQDGNSYSSLNLHYSMTPSQGEGFYDVVKSNS